MTSSLSEADLAAGARLMARLDAFAAFTDEPGRLTRLFLSDAHRRAAAAFIGWCGEAGLAARIDAAGNVVARYEGKRTGAPALMLGSHIDTVRDAGRYDGNYGALAALAVVEALSAAGERLEHAIEIVAFGDEEGVRFRSTLTGSRALAGAYLEDALDQRDAGGVVMRDALKAFGGDPDKAGSIRANTVAAFVEAHIEQGPVLEAEGLPLGVVTAINGATRLEAGVDGMAGHAGATPMSLRRDALTATAEMALAIETRARLEADLVATVGRLEVWPGATNVIPGHVQFSIDLRAPDAYRRHRDRSRGECEPGQDARSECFRLRSSDRGGHRAGGRTARSPAETFAVWRRARHDGHGRSLSGRHSVRPLQGRRQPQSAGIDHGRRLRLRPCGADPLRAGFPDHLNQRGGDGSLSAEGYGGTETRRQ
jgi:allantoate deiminase